MADLGGNGDRPRILEGVAWRRAFDAAPPEARVRVEAAVKEGRALSDPADAALAVGLAIERRKMATYGVIVAVAVGIVMLGFGTRESSGIAIAVLALLPLGAAGWAHSKRSKALKAELHNRDVVFEAISNLPTPPPPKVVADPWEGLPPPRVEPEPIEQLEEESQHPPSEGDR